MKLKELVVRAADKTSFTRLRDYIDFCCFYLDFISASRSLAEMDNLQARIVSQNETNYRFLQYKDDGFFNITRPINADLMYGADDVEVLRVRLPEVLRNLPQAEAAPNSDREVLRRSIYTLQQSIGAALQYAVNTTFLAGHFRGYTVKLNPLDGVYYCDLRPMMRSDVFLSQHIKSIDRLFCDDLSEFLEQPGISAPLVLEPVRESPSEQ